MTCYKVAHRDARILIRLDGTLDNVVEAVAMAADGRYPSYYHTCQGFRVRRYLHNLTKRELARAVAAVQVEIQAMMIRDRFSCSPGPVTFDDSMRFAWRNSI